MPKTSPPLIRRRRSSATAAFAVAALMTLAACGGDQGSGAGASSGDSLTIVGAAQPQIFAADAGGGGSYEFLEFIANNGATLIRYPYVKGAGGALEQDPANFEGVLAESWDVSEDGLTYTFHLRQDAVSQQGNPLTAEDVRWSFERKFNSVSSSLKTIMSPFFTDLESQLKVIDEHTVAFTITEAGAGATFLGNLASAPASQIYDSTFLLEHATPDDPYAVEWTRSNANYGFGAYELTEYRPGEGMVLEANPDYVLGEPEIKTIQYRVVQDPGTRANLLRNQDVGIAEELLPKDQVDLAAQGIIELPEVNTNNLNSLQLVSNKPPFDNVKVRQAFARAIPYEEIIENVYHSRASSQIGLIPPALPNYDGSGLEPYSYDPAAAQALLTEAGFPEGVPVTLTVSNAVPDLQATAIQIQSFAKPAGFDIHVNEVPPTEILSGRRDGTFQAYLMRQQLINLAPYYILDWWFKDEPTANIAQWFAADYRAILATGAKVDDQYSPEANVIWNKAQRMLVEQAPVIVIATVQPLSGFAKDIAGYAWRTDNVLDYSQFTYSN